jgi:Lrp/AsnC family transcriptional regulator for asnA, asnC and gidA
MIDKLNNKLIQELQQDGRKDYVDLAKQFGVADGTVRKRIRNLSEKGIIKIVAVPNLSELGYKFISIVGLQVAMPKMREIANHLAKNPHVSFLSFTTGRFDLLAIIACRDSEEYASVWEKDISTVSGIVRTEASVTLNIIKGSGSLLDTVALIQDLDSS